MTHKQKTKVDELRDALKKKGDLEQHANTQKSHEPAGAGKNGDAAADELTAQIHAAEEEAKNHYDKLLRVMAEFENFKRRMGKEQEEQLKYSNEKLINELLPMIDDLDRVLDHVPPGASEETKAIADGVGLVRKSLLAALDRFGLKEVPAEGEPFDPSRHEAIAAIESEAHAPGNVVAVHRRGYWLFDRLLRPAMVTVSKAKDS